MDEKEIEHIGSQFSDSCNAASKHGVIIKAIGVGGGGGNAVTYMARQGIEEVNFVLVNTDSRQMAKSEVGEKVQIGPGLGAGNDPDVAREYAEENIDKIRALFEDDTQMVFITAGMGGGTGTGAAPVVAQAAREKGVLTIGIVTIPFLFEGRKKIIKAFEGVEEMRKHVDALLVINNERLSEIYPDLTFVNAYGKADETLADAARSISEIITKVGEQNLDFKDVETTLRDSGAAIISTGYAEGEGRVGKAIAAALASPLLRDRQIKSATRLLFNVYFSEENQLQMKETQEINNFVTEIEQDLDVIWGWNIDNSLGSKIKITILAAGFDLKDGAPDVVKKGKETPSDEVKTKPDPTPGTDKSSTEIQKAYGDRADQDRIVIMTPEQMDDDRVIEFLETHPAYGREKRLVNELKSLAATQDTATAYPQQSSGTAAAQSDGTMNIFF